MGTYSPTVGAEPTCEQLPLTLCTQTEGSKGLLELQIVFRHRQMKTIRLFTEAGLEPAEIQSFRLKRGQIRHTPAIMQAKACECMGGESATHTCHTAGKSLRMHGGQISNTPARMQRKTCDCRGGKSATHLPECKRKLANAEGANQPHTCLSADKKLAIVEGGNQPHTCHNADQSLRV